MSEQNWLRRREHVIVLGIILGGMILRLWGWISLIPRTTETWHVAVSLATTGRFDDVFRPGSGPTAHVAPVMPLLISAVYRIFGVSSPTAEWVLCTIAVVLIGISIGFAYLLMRQIGMAWRARMIAVALVSLLPIQFAMEVRELKVWEAPLAVASLIGLLVLVVRLDTRGVRRISEMVPPLVIAGFLALLSPPVGLAGFVAISILVLRRVTVRQWPTVATLTLVITACFIMPWALHNRATLGRVIATRSDAGLEIALALNDTMLDATDPRAAFIARHLQIHPIKPNGYIAMQAAGGELAYYDGLGKQTMSWISAHPKGTVILLARHVKEYFIPPPWFFDQFGTTTSPTATLRSAYLAVTVLLAVFGLPILISQNRQYMYILATAMILVLPYLVVQPILRYRYLVYTLSIFIAVDVVARAFVHFKKQRQLSEGALAGD